MKKWIGLFVVMYLVSWQDGGENAGSRFAALQSMTEQHTFQLAQYQGWTMDWAQTPDGRYFSNKAPGPMFLAFPISWVMNRGKELILGKRALFTYDNGLVSLTQPEVVYRTILSFLTQIIPYLLLVLASVAWLKKTGASYAAQNFTIIALLFGNTAAIFMNMFFGHGMAAWMLLALLLCLSKRNYVLSGLLFGFAALCDYGTIFVAIPFFAGVILKEKGEQKPLVGKALLQVCLGGIIPGILWVWYHTACFGAPWNLPMKFQNPKFVESSLQKPALWGIANPFPDPSIFLQLCFGTRRGILFTQPWIWVLIAGIATSAFQKKIRRSAYSWIVICLGGLFGLIWMNAGFNGWHGGASAGPRYLCIIFPCIALLAGSFYDQFNRRFQMAMWATLGVAVFFGFVVYSTTPLAAGEPPIWSFYWNFFLHEKRLALRIITFLAVTGVFTGMSISAWRKRDQIAISVL